MTSSSSAMVAILMCTYNGERFIGAQLESIAKQTHRQWKLLVSDDGSSDRTIKIVREFASRYPAGQVLLFKGPSQGFAKNFLSLLYRPELDCPLIAFADQDDVWLPNKLSQAAQTLYNIDEQMPALYASRTCFIDEQGAVLGESTLFTQPPSFANALVQSIGGGNTMMINRAALNLICAASQNINIVSHDWWVYIVITAMGGVVHYDPIPAVHYRQHAGNLMGMNTTFTQRARRVAMLIAGNFRNWNERNIAALLPLRLQMPEGARATLDAFRAARKKSLFDRVCLMRQVGIYRQTWLGNLGLWFAVITNRI
jgi:glycosyltransferase involved in cell wall biosynthesis